MAKNPKSRCYSTTASSDYRYACTIRQKNLGEQHTEEICNVMNLSPGKHHLQHINRTQEKLIRRRALIKTPEYKRRRNELKAKRRALRYHKGRTEGITYENNCSLFTETAENNHETDFEFHDNETPIILFDLETSGFERNCDILQIAAKYGEKTFSTYVNPTKQISAAVTAANGLVNCQGILMLHGNRVNSTTIRLAIVSFLEWLKSLNKKCYLAAHNLAFDGPRLFRAMSSCSLVDEFSEVVSGFVDTLKVIRKITSRKGKGACSISGLCIFYNISNAGAHNAVYDCKILSKILYKANVTGRILVNDAKTFMEKIHEWRDEEEIVKNVITLLPLQS